MSEDNFPYRVKVEGGSLPTPSTLDQCVTHILCYRPPKGLMPDQWVRGIIRDYMAQKFGVAILKCENSGSMQDLRNLWQSLTGEEFP